MRERNRKAGADAGAFPEGTSPGHLAGFAAIVVACWLLTLLWVTGQSFWLDEGMAVSKSVMPTFGEFWKGFSATRASDIQQPLFMISSWAWAKVVGCSEWGLRAQNWLWMALAFGFVASRPQWNRRVRLLWCALAALSPFLAMYMDEAKGYIMHFVAGTLLFLPIAALGEERTDRFAFGTFSVGLLLTCGLALTGVVYAFWPCLWLLARLVREKSLSRFLAAHWGWLAVDAAGLAVLAGWYLHTLAVGARGTFLGPPSVSTMGFLAYEWFGFSGMGPSRLVMRVEQVRALRPFVVPLALYAGANVFFALEWWLTWHRRRRVAAGMGRRRFQVPAYAMPFLLGLLGVVSMHVIGFADDMAVRARHVMPVFPAALFVVAVWGDRMWESRRAAPRAALAVLLAAMAVSAFAFRFGERHGKENYRHAAALALAALRAGQCVWWSADGNSAWLYGLREGGTNRFYRWQGTAAADLEAAPAPDVVFINRPDTWDIHGNIARYVAEHGLRQVDEFTGFRVYRPDGERTK